MTRKVEHNTCKEVKQQTESQIKIKESPKTKQTKIKEIRNPTASIADNLFDYNKIS